MKYLFLLLLFPSFASADEWTSVDTKREVAYQTLAAIDWLQTRNIAQHPERWHEQNPILREHPNVQSVNHYFVLTGLAHIVISNLLQEQYRVTFQYISIGVEVGAVANNFSIGVNVRF